MNKKNTFKVFVGTLTAAVVAVGTVSFTAITAIADETVSYYGISADGTVLSGTVTDYTKITSSDTAWGIAGEETWYVADGNLTVNSGAPIELLGNVNIILKDGAEFIIGNGIEGTDAAITFYSEADDKSGIIAFMGAAGKKGGFGQVNSGSERANGEQGSDGKVAVDVSSFTVAGGTVTVVGGKGGNGGEAGYGEDYYTHEVWYDGIGGNGGNGGMAFTNATKVYLNSGRLNATAGRGGEAGLNTHVSSEQRDNYKGEQGNPGKAVDGIYAVNGILNVNKSDNSDATDVSGDYELFSVNAPIGSYLDIQSSGTTFVNSGTIITTRGDISVANKLEVEGAIRINGKFTASSQAEITKTNGGVIRRITPVAGEGYTLDNSNGLCDPEYGYNIMLSDGTLSQGFVGSSVIVSENNRLNIIRCGDGDIIDNSEPFENIMPYCFRVNDTPNTVFTGGNVFAEAGTNSKITFALNYPDEYCFSGVTVTDWDGNTVPADKYTFDKQTGEFTAVSVDCNMKVAVNAQLKDVEISVTDESGDEVLYAGFSTVYDNGTSAEPFAFKIKVTEGGSVAKYRVVKESDLDKATGIVNNTSSFVVSYSNGNDWGTADDGSSKIAKDESATFTIKPDSGLAAGTYTEDYIVITDRSTYADRTAGTQDKALARFTVTYTVEHESDNLLHYSDLTGHYNLCTNCQGKINKADHTFDIRIVSNDTFAKPASCTNPSEYYYSCECGAHTDDITLTFENGDPTDHTFGEWTNVIPAGCLTSGSDKRVCSVCSYEETREVQPTGHIWEDDFTTDIKPGCTEKGSKSVHCSKCDEVKDVTEIPENGHSFGEWTILNLTDCTQGGIRQHVCTVCNFTEIDDIPPQEHLWNDDFTVDIEPTCTQSGSKSIHCSRCDTVKDITEIKPTGHEFTEWSVNSDATCVEKGQKTRSCTVCGYTEYDNTDINSDAHLWQDDFTIDKEPTCTEEGSKSVHCSRCNATKDSTVIPLSDHIYGEWETMIEATCTENGKRKHICVNCGYEEDSVITADHIWDTKTTVDKEPTCTEDGSQSIHCTKCNAQKEIQPIPANGHDWSEWIMIKKSTTTVNGIEERECYVCGTVEKNELDLIADNASDLPDSKPENPGTDASGWSSDEHHHWHIDSNGNRIDFADHEFRWVVDKEPNGTEPGIGHYECISCDYAEFPREFGGKDSPETGSESLALWIAVAFVAGGVAPITLKIKSRKNK